MWTDPVRKTGVWHGRRLGQETEASMSADRPSGQEEGNVTKKEIVKTISENVDLTQLKTKEVVQKTFDAITDTLVKMGRIELRNFGVFEVKKREPRKARNPRTGAEVFVPAKNVVTFKPGKEMADKIHWAQAAGS